MKFSLEQRVDVFALNWKSTDVGGGEMMERLIVHLESCEVIRQQYLSV